MVGLESRSRGRDRASRLNSKTVRKKPLSLIILLALLMIGVWHLVYFVFQREPSAKDFCVKAVDRLVEGELLLLNFESFVESLFTQFRQCANFRENSARSYRF